MGFLCLQGSQGRPLYRGDIIRNKGSEPCLFHGAENSRPRKQVQRPGGRSSLGLLEEQEREAWWSSRVRGVRGLMGSQGPGLGLWLLLCEHHPWQGGGHGAFFAIGFRPVPSNHRSPEPLSSQDLDLSALSSEQSFLSERMRTQTLSRWRTLTGREAEAAPEVRRVILKVFALLFPP